MLGARRELEIQPVEDDAAWYNCAELKHLDWCEHAPPERVEAGNSSIVQRLISAIRLKCPPVRYVLAYQMAVQSAIPVPGRAATAWVKWKISRPSGISPPRQCGGDAPPLRGGRSGTQRGTDGDCRRPKEYRKVFVFSTRLAAARHVPAVRKRLCRSPNHAEWRI